MKTKKLFSSLITVFTAICLFAPSSALAAAFGISPPWIENQNIKPGTNFSYIINVSSKDLSNKMKVNIDISGDEEIKRWITIPDTDNLIMSTGESLVPMMINLAVPQDALLGNYQGNIKLTLSNINEQPAGIATLLGGNIAVDLNVVNYDVIDYKVKEIKVDSISEGQPLNLKMTVKNLGNKMIDEVETKASIIDQKSDAVIASGSASRLSGPVQPQNMADVQLRVPMADVSAGTYWLDVESFKEGASIYKGRLSLIINPQVRTNNNINTGVEVMGEGYIKPSAFNIFKSGGDATVATSVKVRAPLTNQLIIVIIGILLVLTGIVGKFYMTFKKRRR